MKRLFLLILFIIIPFSSYAWYTWDDKTKEIYTQDQDDVMTTNDLNDPLRNGTRSAVEHVEWIIDEDTSTAKNNQKNIMKYVTKWVNYFLTLLWLLATIFIIKDGIVIITARWDDNKQKEAFKNVKNYTIALIGIWVSYLIVILIFHFVIFNSTI